jgi:hypothetical protein
MTNGAPNTRKKPHPAKRRHSKKQAKSTEAPLMRYRACAERG